MKAKCKRAHRLQNSNISIHCVKLAKTCPGLLVRMVPDHRARSPNRQANLRWFEKTVCAGSRRRLTVANRHMADARRTRRPSKTGENRHPARLCAKTREQNLASRVLGSVCSRASEETRQRDSNDTSA